MSCSSGPGMNNMISSVSGTALAVKHFLAQLITYQANTHAIIKASVHSHAQQRYLTSTMNLAAFLE